MTPLELLEASFAFTRTKIVGAQGADPGAPTPCTEWDVQHLLNHTIASADEFASVVDGSTAQFDVESWAETPYAGDPAAAYDEAVAHALAAFGAPGALERTVSMGSSREAPVAVIVYPCAGDALLHGWDLAKATGQDTALPEGAAGEVYAFMQRMAGDGPRPNFAPAVPVPEDAPIGDRLVGFSGRHP